MKPEKKELERREVVIEVNAEENESGSVITGRPIVFDSMTNIGEFDEIIEQTTVTAP